MTLLGVTLNTSFGDTVWGAPFKAIWEIAPPWMAIVLSAVLLGVMIYALWDIWTYITEPDYSEDPEEESDEYQFEPGDFE